MKRVFAGIKPTVGPVLKIMKVGTDDPLTTPSTSWEKYLFDSEQAKLGYVYDIKSYAYPNPAYPMPGATGFTTYYVPTGSSGSTATEIIISSNSVGAAADLETHYLFDSYFGLSYAPIVEWRRLGWPVSGRFSGPQSSYVQSASGGGPGGIGECGFIGGGPGYEGFSSSSIPTISTRHHMPISLNSLTATNVVVSAWELPAFNVAYPSYAGSPSSGQLALRLSPTMARLAYPGHQATDSVPHIFSESRVPAKAMACGEVTIAAGANTTVSTSLPTSAATYMDFHVRRSSNATWYHPPLLPGSAKTDSVDVQYEVLSQGVKIYNAGSESVVVRYLVLADDDSANSTGGTKVVRTANDGVQDYFQIKVPGSSDSGPHLNDILVDTRLAYFPLVAEGYLAYADFTEATDFFYLGEVRKTINFTNGGFLPFVKYVTVYSDHYSVPSNKLLKVYFASSSWGDHCTGDSVNCRISSNKLEFYMAQPNPSFLSFDGGGNVVANHNAKPIGIRWYLFALPTSL